jgi:hypothetical protein
MGIGHGRSSNKLAATRGLSHVSRWHFKVKLDDVQSAGGTTNH